MDASAKRCETFDVARMHSALQGIVAMKMRSPSVSTSSPTYGLSLSSSLSESGARSGISSILMSADGIEPA
jgi:hypothetical protein